MPSKQDEELDRSRQRRFTQHRGSRRCSRTRGTGDGAAPRSRLAYGSGGTAASPSPPARRTRPGACGSFAAARSRHLGIATIMPKARRCFLVISRFASWSPARCGTRPPRAPCPRSMRQICPNQAPSSAIGTSKRSANLRIIGTVGHLFGSVAGRAAACRDAPPGSDHRSWPGSGPAPVPRSAPLRALLEYSGLPGTHRRHLGRSNMIRKARQHRWVLPDSISQFLIIARYATFEV